MKKEFIATLKFMLASFVLFFASSCQLVLGIISISALMLERMCDTMVEYFAKRTRQTKEYIVNL